jgi:transposase
VLADKAYDGNAIRDLIEGQGAVPNIPAKSNRKWRPCFSNTLYRERNQVERFFSKLKHFRRIATRYDKLAENFLAMVKLASMRLWLRANESTAYGTISQASVINPRSTFSKAFTSNAAP